MRHVKEDPEYWVPVLKPALSLSTAYSSLAAKYLCSKIDIKIDVGRNHNFQCVDL